MKPALRHDHLYPIENEKKYELELVTDQKLLVSTGTEESVIQILSPQGKATVTIRVTAAGPLIQLEGAHCTLAIDGLVNIQAESVSVNAARGINLCAEGDLRFQAGGDVSIGGQSVSISGQKQVVQTSDGDVRIQAEGILQSKARSQNIHADLGNINIKANDDVTLDGERIRMNC